MFILKHKKWWFLTKCQLSTDELSFAFLINENKGKICLIPSEVPNPAEPLSAVPLTCGVIQYNPI